MSEQDKPPGEIRSNLQVVVRLLLVVVVAAAVIGFIYATWLRPDPIPRSGPSVTIEGEY